MRSSTVTSPLALLSTLLVTSTQFKCALAHPQLARSPQPQPTSSPFPGGLDDSGNVLAERACNNPCGYYGQICCAYAGACYTDSNQQAQCSGGAAATVAGGNGGGFNVYTTTYVETNFQTVTTIYSLAAAAATGQICNTQLGQTSCGSICCASGQFCNAGICVNNGASTQLAASTASVLSPDAGTATNSPFIRPTSMTTYTVIATGTFTTTIPFLTPVSTAAGSTGSITAQSTSPGLSGGAIAGIVIGVLLGLLLLFLLIIFCCFRGFLGIFRPKRRTTVEERYESRHHSGGGGASQGPGRFGGIFGGGRRNDGRTSQRKSGGNWLGIAGILGALALVLGFKRRQDRKNEEKSEYSDENYSSQYSEGSSASSASSDDRRTRDSRRSGGGNYGNRP